MRRDSGVRTLADLSGKTLVALKGSVQAKWFEDHMPDVRVLRLNSAADALQTFRQGRTDAYTHDAGTLVIAVAHEPDAKLVGQYFLISDAAIGVRKNEAVWRDYLSAAIARMRCDNLFVGWVAQYVPQDIRSYYLDVFQNGRPDETGTPGKSLKAKIKSAAGLNFDTTYLVKQWPTLWSGTLMTLKVSAIAMVLLRADRRDRLRDPRVRGAGAVALRRRIRRVDAQHAHPRATVLHLLRTAGNRDEAVAVRLRRAVSHAVGGRVSDRKPARRHGFGRAAHVRISCLALALRPWHYFASVAMPIAVRNALPSMLNTAISLLKNSSYL